MSADYPSAPLPHPLLGAPPSSSHISSLLFILIMFDIVVLMLLQLSDLSAGKAGHVTELNPPNPITIMSSQPEAKLQPPAWTLNSHHSAWVPGVKTPRKETGL
ncbi:hypothetical protein ElyMa_002772000 [Elysia marginata]|uniref:Uncharacterized protein n=1 Tax=Elysia marginata TaxID=1093978 RepID=A0AAV4HPR0_9GAST|nr:hypothetical protein ElyMa_002772000 [Elysia marginata]